MKNNLDFFKDKIAIVTGAGSGIGRSLAMALSNRGARVVISDINTIRIEKVKTELEESGGKVSATTLDVSDYDAVNRMIKSVAAEHGRVDYMFSNAGIAIGGEVRDITIKEWRKTMEVNLFGVINCVDSVYPIMVKQGKGHIVNIASIEGLIPFPGHISYTASKFGIVGLSHGLRIEGTSLGVKVTVVCPGYIDTPIFQESEMVNLDREKVLKLLDLISPMSPDDCAQKILAGVRRNRGILVIPFRAKILWYLYRFVPNLIFKITLWRRNILDDSRIDDSYESLK